MIKIGVTGANGFIGWHLSSHLYLNQEKFQIVEFKRNFFYDKKKLDKFVLNCDIIVHLAGINRDENQNYIYSKNVELADNLIDSFLRTNFNGKLIFSSSVQESKENSFGISKKLCSTKFIKWAKSKQAVANCLIIPNVFGPFCKPNYNSVIATFCYKLINNEKPEILNDQIINLIYIDGLIKNIIDCFSNNITQSIKIDHEFEFKVSEILCLLKNYNENYIKKGIIPNIDSDFKISLFNTFRSHINLKLHFPFKYKNNVDKRGSFVELVREESGGQFSFSSTNPKFIRGNHFHSRKIERFSVISGQALVRMRKIRSNEIIEFYLDGKDPSFIDMPIWFTHNIKNIGNELLLTNFWINEPYQNNDPDTYFLNVLK